MLNLDCNETFQHGRIVWQSGKLVWLAPRAAAKPAITGLDVTAPETRYRGMQSAIDTLTRNAETCEANAPIHEAAGDQAQAELDRRLADEYRQAARHLKAVES